MLNNSYPILSRLLIYAFLPLVLLLTLIYIFLKQSLPLKEGIVYLQGLNAEVVITRDKHAIPHIRAKTDIDAFFSMGYLHAQDRMWQMEYQRRLGQGRLSEILGIRALQTDQYFRTLGLYRAAKTSIESLDSAARNSLMAYVAGINAWLKEANTPNLFGLKTLPIEYYILGFEPEPWRPEDSLLQIKLLALTLGANYIVEIIFDLLVKELGLAKASALMPQYSREEIAVSESSKFIEPSLQENLLALNGYLEEQLSFGLKGVGSNAWVVSGKLTESGKPLLANDPHLASQIPSVWYLAEIEGGEIHATGATLPGLPYVVLGHNQSITWGVTSLSADTQDLYLERTHPLNEDLYEFEGQWLPVEVYEEWIHVKSGFLAEPIPPLKWQVRRTSHGPLISDVVGEADYPLALRWTALDDQDETFQSYLNINYAQDWNAFKKALKNYVAPAVNFLYADIEGNIAYAFAGKIPFRHQGSGKLPAPGWLSSYNWDGYLPFEDLPRSINPESGYIVSANNKNYFDDYPHLISNNWAPPYRAERISELLKEFADTGKKITTMDFLQIQGDQKSLQVEEILSFFNQLSPQTSSQSHAIEQLKSWDGIISKNSVAASIYQSWLRNFNRLLLQDDLRGDLLHIKRGDFLQDFVEQIRPLVIAKLLNQEELEYNWCDQINTEVYESCEDLALAALDKSIKELKLLAGNNEDWLWGKIHKTYYPHSIFADVPLLNAIFDREVRNGGDAYSINVASWNFSKDKGYRQLLSPSYRQVVDLNNWNNSSFITNTGQSGHLLSENYDDYIRLHNELDILPMNFGLDSKQASDSVLLLRPISLP